jgi:hypothetical protein
MVKLPSQQYAAAQEILDSDFFLNLPNVSYYVGTYEMYRCAYYYYVEHMPRCSRYNYIQPLRCCKKFQVLSCLLSSEERLRWRSSKHIVENVCIIFPLSYSRQFALLFENRLVLKTDQLRTFLSQLLPFIGIRPFCINA